jgi:pSer/pThr/pTyr-binding forkhead associated (FHA) protein/tetratricopeptide (TPR) repeat protein
MFTLSVEDDQGRKTELQFAAPGLTIGRAKDNQLRLNERNVSRKHARINASNGTVSIEDLDSYNGIRVNGDRIAGKTSLYLGDSIQLGDFRLQLSGDNLRPRREEVTQKTMIPKREEEVTNTEPMVVAPLNTGPQAQQQPPVQKQQTQMDRDESTALIRLSDIAPKGSGQAQAISGPHPKLVCIKGPMAGREWPVSKTEVIIGRGQENDVVVDHRSLSRQHAKIVLNGSQYRVVDFNSSNGTLVNGERYAQVDLKRGDVIELGHVKFRLMWPGEVAPVIDQARDDAFDESTEVVRPAARASASPGPLTQANQQPVKSNKGLFIAIGVGSLVAVVAIVLVIGLQSESSQTQPATVKTAANDVPVQHDITPQPTTAAAANPTPTTPPAQANQDVALILKRANAEMASEQWDQAVRILETALETQPGQLALKAALERCEKERSAKTALDAGNAGFNRGDYQGAKDSYQQVPESSMYYQRAAKRLQDPKIRSAGTTIAVVKQPKNDKPERTEKPERYVEPKSEPKAVKQPKDDPPAQKDPPVAAVQTPPPTAAESPRDQAKKLFDQGNKALLQNKTKEAIELYLEATRTDPKYALPHRGLGIAHARLANGEAAVEHYKIYLRLSPGAADAEQVKKIIHDYESPD